MCQPTSAYVSSNKIIIHRPNPLPSDMEYHQYKLPLYDNDEEEKSIPVYHDEPSISSAYTQKNEHSMDYSEYNSKRESSNNNYEKLFQSYGSHPIQAAVVSRHQIHYVDVPTYSKPIKPTTVEVSVSSIPVNILFRSASSKLNVKQMHQSSSGNTQETSSEDEPHRLVHTVTKPIIQEVHEVISPFRKVIQEIRPLQEEIQTIVARANNPAAILYGGTGYHAVGTQDPIITQQQLELQRIQYHQQQQQQQQHYHQQLDHHQLQKQQQQQIDDVNYQLSTVESSNRMVPNDHMIYVQDFQQLDDVEQKLLDQMGQDYLTASSNALLTSVYGVPAFASSKQANETRIDIFDGTKEQQNQQFTTIDAELLNKYFPLVYEVINTMEHEANNETSSSDDDDSSES